MSHVEEKGSILWVIVKRWIQFCESYWKEGFNSVSHLRKTNSILWGLCKKKRVQFCGSYSKRVQFFDPFFSKKNQFSLEVIWKKKGSILWVTLKRRVSFCESYEKEWFNFCEFIFFQKGSVLGVIFLLSAQCLEFFFLEKIKIFEATLKKSSNSLSHIQQKKVQFLWVISKKKRFSS